MKKVLNPFVTFVGIIFFWELMARVFHIPAYILPQPSHIFKTLIDTIDIMAPHLLITSIEAALGFLLAAFTGIILSIIFNLSVGIKAAFYPYVIIIRVAPVIAIAPFLILWFGNDLLSKVFTAAIMSLFFVIVNFSKGLQEVSQESLDLMMSLSSTRWQTIMKLKIPNAIPYLFAGLKMSTATSIAGAVVSEFVGSDRGLGFLIVTNFYYLKTEMMFSALFILFLLGVSFYGIVALVEETFFTKYSINKS